MLRHLLDASQRCKLLHYKPFWKMDRGHGTWGQAACPDLTFRRGDLVSPGMWWAILCGESPRSMMFGAAGGFSATAALWNGRRSSRNEDELVRPFMRDV